MKSRGAGRRRVLIRMARGVFAPMFQRFFAQRRGIAVRGGITVLAAMEQRIQMPIIIHETINLAWTMVLARGGSGGDPSVQRDAFGPGQLTGFILQHVPGAFHESP